MEEKLREELEEKSDKKRAINLSRFFKTGKGEYGEGDVFIGIKVPELREISKKYKELDLENIQKLLNSEIHEERMISLFILIEKYKKLKKEDEDKKEEIFNFYLNNTKNINNWDLVDLSAPNIVGDFLLNKNRKILKNLVKSKNLWERRISVLSCFSFIKNNEFEDALKISEILLKDTHDLIHKAVGWMLREIGKKNQEIEENFLKKYYKNMPRTMLRYSIEKFPEDLRLKYLRGEV